MRCDVRRILFLVGVLLILSLGFCFADTGTPAVPEIQGITTETSLDVAGTVTETDSGAWTLTNNPFIIGSYRYVRPTAQDPATAEYGSTSIVFWKDLYQQLLAAGGSADFTDTGHSITIRQLNVPESLLNTPIASISTSPHVETWQQFLKQNHFLLGGVSQNGISEGIPDPGQVQYTSGYSDQYSGISGRQTFTKTVALSAGNKIADQSNIKATTNIQFIALDAGRATRSEDLLLDGAAMAQNSSGIVLCPFLNANPGIIPAFCTIEQAGSTFDSTLTSTATYADTRFVGTEATIPVVMNYNINAQGITLGDGTSSPMIGSVSAYLKIHVQEARNESVVSIQSLVPMSFTDEVHATKSEDLVYSETSSASGLITQFSKSMSYSSQASAVPAPVQSIPLLPGIG